jgi:hypothetical protein
MLVIIKGLTYDRIKPKPKCTKAIMDVGSQYHRILQAMYTRTSEFLGDIVISQVKTFETGPYVSSIVLNLERQLGMLSRTANKFIQALGRHTH